jgi:hypothetical protein
LCREHGQQLSSIVLAANNNDNFGFWGIVKETGVDDEGLLEFYKSYYTFPLYRDETLSSYSFFGNKKLSLPSYNPWKLWKGYKKLSKRLKSKPELEGNLKGEGMVKGGILILDKDGVVQFALEEPTGEELDLDMIQSAMDVVSKGGGVSKAEL